MPDTARVLRDFGVPVPARIRALPVDRRGYPVPYFVQRGPGEPDFRIMDTQAAARAMRLRLCWVCGQPLGRHASFVGGPMSELTCAFADLPSHLECARFSAHACPFLANPAARMRGTDLPDGVGISPGQVEDNPGMAAVVTTRDYSYEPSAMAFVVGTKDSVDWYARGRPASEAEITAAKEKAAVDVARIREERLAAAKE